MNQLPTTCLQHSLCLCKDAPRYGFVDGEREREGFDVRMREEEREREREKERKKERERGHAWLTSHRSHPFNCRLFVCLFVHCSIVSNRVSVCSCVCPSVCLFVPISVFLCFAYLVVVSKARECLKHLDEKDKNKAETKVGSNQLLSTIPTTLTAYFA